MQVLLGCQEMIRHIQTQDPVSLGGSLTILGPKSLFLDILFLRLLRWPFQCSNPSQQNRLLAFLQHNFMDISLKFSALVTIFLLIIFGCWGYIFLELSYRKTWLVIGYMTVNRYHGIWYDIRLNIHSTIHKFSHELYTFTTHKLFFNITNNDYFENYGAFTNEE